MTTKGTFDMCVDDMNILRAYIIRPHY